METTKESLNLLVGRELHYWKIAFNYAPWNQLFLATISQCFPEMTNDGGNEPFQQFDNNDEPITIEGVPVVFLRRECHGKNRIMNTFHRGCDILVIDSENRILVPTRAADKDLYPGMTDTSVGEHVKVGEPYLQAAIRGAQEEFNFKLNPEHLKLAIHANIKDEMQWQFCHYYLYFLGDEAIAKSDEISNFRWITIVDLQGKNLLEAINLRPDHCGNYEFIVNNIKRFL